MKKAKFVITEKFAHIPDQVDVTPVMNLFCILIPFLLLTAVFAQTVVIEINLPREGVGTTAQLQEEMPPDQLRFVMVNIKKDGVHVATDKKIYPPVPVSDWNDEASLTDFEKQLQDILAQFPEQQDVILISPDETPYAVLIQLMDICINTGLTNVSLSSPQRGQSAETTP